MAQNDEKKTRTPSLWLVVLQAKIMSIESTFAEARAFQKGLRSPETVVLRAYVVCEGDGSDPLRIAG